MCLKDKTKAKNERKKNTKTHKKNCTICLFFRASDCLLFNLFTCFY